MLMGQLESWGTAEALSKPSFTWSAMAYFLSLDKQLTKLTHGYVPRVRGVTSHVSLTWREATKCKTGKALICGHVDLARQWRY